MARKTATEPAAEAVEATPQEAALLAIADLIYAAYGNSSTATVTVVEETLPEPEDEPIDEVDADEVDADEVDLDAERERLMKLTIGDIRKELVARDFDADEVASEKSKSALVDSLLDDLYGEEDEDDIDEDDESEEEPEDADTDEVEDDEDDEDDEDSEDEDEEGDEDEEDEDAPYTEEELSEFSTAELKEIAQEWEIEVSKGARAKTYIKAILEAQEAEEESDADADEDEYEDVDRAELEGLTLAALRKRAKEEFGLTAGDVKGQDKDAILDMIFEDED